MECLQEMIEYLRNFPTKKLLIILARDTFQCTQYVKVILAGQPKLSNSCLFVIDEQTIPNANEH